MTTAATWNRWNEWPAKAGSEEVDAREVARQRMDADAELVDRCLRGSEGAWEQLVKAHSRLVYGACYRFTGRADQARDLTQDVFLRVFRSLHTYRSESGAFKTWLVRLTRNLLIDHYRKNKKEQKVDSIEDQAWGLEETSGIGGQADRTLRSREAGELLQSGLAQLSPELREAVILRDLQEMEYKEIASALAVPEGTVKSRINRGRRELARRLTALGVTR